MTIEKEEPIHTLTIEAYFWCAKCDEPIELPFPDRCPKCNADFSVDESIGQTWDYNVGHTDECPKDTWYDDAFGHSEEYVCGVGYTIINVGLDGLDCYPYPNGWVDLPPGEYTIRFWSVHENNPIQGEYWDSGIFFDPPLEEQIEKNKSQIAT